MNSRLRTLRLARGLSLCDLADRIGNAVSIMAISKYERGLLFPSPPVAERLAAALGVRREDLFAPSTVSVTPLQYRKRFDFRKRDEEHLLNLAQLALEQRVRVQELVAPGERPVLPRKFRVRTLDDAEQAASELRRFWNLGTAPVRNLTATLERHLVHVVAVDMPESFDGLSLAAHRDDSRELLAVAVVSRRLVSGERWRMNLAHELGHIVMETERDVDDEKAAFRFAGALLAPAPALHEEVGTRRRQVALEELLELRRRYGMSMQGLLYRLKVLGILSGEAASHWWKSFARRGWRKKEPDESLPEEPTWIQYNVRRACCEGLLSLEEGQSLMPEGETLVVTVPRPRTAEEAGQDP